MDSPSSREQALEFLEGMERRHNEILDSLDELNARIERVLATSLTQPGELEAGSADRNAS